jgi:hypothetical protein
MEFNERILNPSSWQAKIRERNRRDMQNHREKRLIQKVKMILDD